ncbi:MAG: hypothetical protein WCC08_17245, partial [Terrimicrobiaceae bacterium]
IHGDFFIGKIGGIIRQVDAPPEPVGGFAPSPHVRPSPSALRKPWAFGLVPATYDPTTRIISSDHGPFAD